MVVGEINSSYTSYAQTITNHKVSYQEGFFSVYEYTGDFSSSPNIIATLGVGGGSVHMSGTSTYNEAEIDSRISINSGDAIHLEVEYNSEASKTNGIYINSVNTPNAGISFVDSTIDSANPSKRYFLKDFALKSDISSSLDLSNYLGKVNLEYRENIPLTDQNLASISTGYNSASGFGVTISSKGKHDSVNDAGFAEIVVSSKGVYGEISFQQTGLNNGQKITLESILNRIIALESKVTELETALANKANVNSPSFTGKVTINPITE